MTDALLLFLGRSGGIDGWLRLDDGAVAERGPGAGGLPAGGGARKTVAVVPGEQVTLQWIDLPPGLAPAQAQAAARMLAAETSIQPPADTHLAIGREAGGTGRCIALVPAAAMAGWTATLREAGVEPDHIVPETLLLPVPEEGFARFDRGEIALYRGAEAAFAAEPELAELLVDGAPVAEIDADAFEASLAGAVERPLVDLRQGAFGRRREWRLQSGRLRRLAVLAAGLLVATLALQIAQIVSYSLAAARAEDETMRIAQAAMPRTGVVGDPAAALERRLARLRGGGVGFTTIAAAAFAAVRSTPNVELSALAFSPDGTLGVTAQGDNAASLADLARRIEAAGFAVEAAPPRGAAGRQLQEMKVRPR